MSPDKAEKEKDEKHAKEEARGNRKMTGKLEKRPEKKDEKEVEKDIGETDKKPRKKVDDETMLDEEESKEEGDEKSEENTEDGKEPSARKKGKFSGRTVKKEETEKDEDEKEDVEIIEAKKEGYQPNQKPDIPEEMKGRLKLRKQIDQRRPLFRRQEGHRYKRLKTGWRKPRGSHSKMRRHYKYRGKVVSIGYGGPKDVRNLHPSGFSEIIIYNPKQLDGIMPETQAARIAHGVGIKKRFDIEKKADELGIRVLNRS